MKELTEIAFGENRIWLEDHDVKSSILPRVTAEIERDITVKGNSRVEGAMYARRLEIQQGPFEISGAVFTQLELHVNEHAQDKIVFRKCVGSADAIVSYAGGCQLQFLADVNAKQVRLHNAYVAASIFADDIVLVNCVVVGGVFATGKLTLTNCVVGTFNAPKVTVSGKLFMLMPSSFSVEPVEALADTECFNLALADLGALMRGTAEAPQSGKIRIEFQKDEQRTVLTGEESQQTLRSYSIAGKVLAVDLLDLDKLQNHFLLSSAGLGSQLLQQYDLGRDAAGKLVELTPDRISAFLFDILKGRVTPSTISATFSLARAAGSMG